MLRAIARKHLVDVKADGQPHLAVFGVEHAGVAAGRHPAVIDETPHVVLAVVGHNVSARSHHHAGVVEEVFAVASRQKGRDGCLRSGCSGSPPLLDERNRDVALQFARQQAKGLGGGAWHCFGRGREFCGSLGEKGRFGDGRLAQRSACHMPGGAQVRRQVARDGRFG